MTIDNQTELGWSLNGPAWMDRDGVCNGAWKRMTIVLVCLDFGVHDLRFHPLLDS